MRRSTACLLALALAAVPALGTAAPLDCRVRPLVDADGWFEEELRKEALLPPDPDPYATAPGGYTSDVKAGTVAPIGVEIVEPPGCPEISD
ncbi:hypothetical protein AB0L65_06480 [Nonomuraea sp. NPDC052116]|uniref:hypothetical protein n=1 Tax=Nonomuraea sp. NPDC052116 TaxID=3155665 RepID=UPI003441AF32